MPVQISNRVSGAEVLLPCSDLEAALPFYVDELGFRIESIYPADAPSVAVLCGHGLRVRLAPEPTLAAGVLQLEWDDDQPPGEIAAPNGTLIRFAAPASTRTPGELERRLVISKVARSGGFSSGRAGMQYRDLIPGRLGGHFIASHIRIPDGGPVPDYVHYHWVRFQMIYCYRGWVRVVYEDQGPPFTLHAGDCVLQPPGIRHRVLESAAGLEVIEFGSPAEHITCADHDMLLPTAVENGDRDFGGQRFVRHVAEEARWHDWHTPGFESRDTGIAKASDGVADVRVVRAHGEDASAAVRHEGETCFMFVLQGGLSVASGSEDTRLTAGDALCLPAGQTLKLRDCTHDLEWLEVSLPGPHQ